MNNKPTTAEITLMAAGGVALLGSFLDWYSVDTAFGSGSANPWSEEGGFPTFAWVGIFGGAIAVLIALELFANVKLPTKVLNFTWPQIHFILADFAALLCISYLIAGSDQAIGFFLSLLASAGLVAGAIMLDKERPSGVRAAPVASPGAPPPMAPPPPPPPA